MWALLWSDARTFGIHKQKIRRNKNSFTQAVSVNPCEPCCRILSVIGLDNSKIQPTGEANKNIKKKLYLKSSIKVIKQVKKLFLKQQENIFLSSYTHTHKPHHNPHKHTNTHSVT